MALYIKDVDKLEATARRYERFEAIPEDEQVRVMLLDTAADEKGNAQLDHIGARKIAGGLNHVYYVFCKSHKVTVIQGMNGFRVKVAVRHEHRDPNALTLEGGRLFGNSAKAWFYDDL